MKPTSAWSGIVESARSAQPWAPPVPVIRIAQRSSGWVARCRRPVSYGIHSIFAIREGSLAARTNSDLAGALLPARRKPPAEAIVFRNDLRFIFANVQRPQRVACAPWPRPRAPPMIPSLCPLEERRPRQKGRPFLSYIVPATCHRSKLRGDCRRAGLIIHVCQCCGGPVKGRALALCGSGVYETSMGRTGQNARAAFRSPLNTASSSADGGER
jgi:hypothetical protein